MNKVMHGIALAPFGAACCFIAFILRLPPILAVSHKLPGFTRLCMALGPALLLGLAVLATGYCLWFWTRRTEPRVSWVAFLAATQGALVLVMLPTILAIVFPFLEALRALAS
jgi:hypothetical protein